MTARRSSAGARSVSHGPPGAGDHLRIAQSPVHGRGLWCREARRAGEPVFVVRGRRVRLRFEDGYHPHWIGVGWQRWLAPERGNPIRFTNHSCEPNVIVTEGLVVVALEDIRAGSEVLLDYSTTEVDPDWSFRCRCGAPRCRGTVRAFPRLPEDVRARYAPHLTVEFLKAARKVAASLQSRTGASDGERRVTRRRHPAP